MQRLPAPPVLQIERSQPTQGQPVTVKFSVEGEVCGTLHLPFKIWIRLNKLIQKGLERQQLEGPEAESNGIRVTVKGFVPPTASDEQASEREFETVFESDPVSEPSPAKVIPGSVCGISGIAIEEEELDPEDAKAVAAAERQAVTLEKLGRTLAKEEESDG